MSSIEKTVEASLLTEETPSVPVSKGVYAYGFVVLFMLFLLDFAARLGVTTAFPLMQKELNLTDSQLGLAGSMVLLGMSAFVLPFAFLADRGQKNRAVAYMGGLWGFGCMLCGLATSFIPLLLGRLTVGMGNASYAPVSVSMLTSWTKKSRWGTTVGFYNSSMAIGMGVGTAVTGYLAHAYGWRVPFFVIGGATLVFSLLALRLPTTTVIAKKEQVGLKEAFSVTLQNKTIVLLGIGVGMVNLINVAMVSWIPVYLVRYMNWDVAEVGGVMGAVYMLKGLGISPISGIIADKLGKWDMRSRAWFGVPCFILLATSFTVGVVFHIFPCIVLGFALIALPTTGVHVATQELVPARYKSCAYGTYVIFLQGLGFVGPILAGALSDNFGLEKALIYIQIVGVLSALAMLIGGFTYRNDHAKARAMEASDSVKAANAAAATA